MGQDIVREADIVPSRLLYIYFPIYGAWLAHGKMGNEIAAGAATKSTLRVDDIAAHAATISSLRSDWPQKRCAFLTPRWSTYRVRSSVASLCPISSCSSA